jgi:5'-nucleotidase
VLSLNVPDRPVDELGALREATLAPFGAVQIRMEHRAGQDGEALYASLSEAQEPAAPGTDLALLAEGHPTLTALRSVDVQPGVLDALRMSPV